MAVDKPQALRQIRAHIRYTSLKNERLGEERGRERIALSMQADGVNLLYAHCEIDDPPQVVRDVMLALRHADSSPVDAASRLSVGGTFEGSGWMRFEGDEAVCESHSERYGRISQRVTTTGPARWLQTHPIFADALLMKVYDLSRGPGKMFFPEMWLTSPDHRGATGPQLYRAAFSIIYVGEEEITVPAGTFKTRRFQVADTAGHLPEEHPAYDVWCSADDDYLLVRAKAGGYMQNLYELVELERDTL